jgi:hypothetical protein
VTLSFSVKSNANDAQIDRLGMLSPGNLNNLFSPNWLIAFRCIVDWLSYGEKALA